MCLAPRPLLPSQTTATSQVRASAFQKDRQASRQPPPPHQLPTQAEPQGAGSSPGFLQLSQCLCNLGLSFTPQSSHL